MNIQSTIIRPTRSVVSRSVPVKTITLPEDTHSVAKQIKDGQKKLVAAADLTKMFCTLAQATGVDDYMNLDLSQLKEVSIFAKKLGGADITKESFLPGTLSRTNLQFPTNESISSNSTPSSNGCVMLAIDEQKVTKAVNAIANPVLGITMNYMNFANDVSQIINDAPKEPATFVESGLTATKQFFETTDQLIKIQGGKSSGLEHLVKFNNTALLGVQAWKSHTDPTSSSYRKIMDALLLGANAIESILGLFGQADHIRQIAGVASVGLKFTDKILTLTVGDEINVDNSLAWAGTLGK